MDSAPISTVAPSGAFVVSGVAFVVSGFGRTCPLRDAGDAGGGER
jgi:hypothetical protein